MTWNSLTFGYQSQLNTTKLGQLMENFSALAGGHSGAPQFASGGIGSASCKRSNLVTATASGSLSVTGSTSYALAGGTYSWWTPSSSAGGGDGAVLIFGGGDTAAGVVGLTKIINNGTFYVDERYIQSSPPYDLGDGHIPLFIFLLVNRDGSIAGSQVAEDPPWANNGPTCLTPHLQRGNKKYRCYRRKGFGGPLLAELSDADKRLFLSGELSLVEDWVEITPEWKNRDMRIFPHPFGKIADDQEVILVDPFRSSSSGKLKEIYEIFGAKEVRDLFLKQQMVINNERTEMRGLGLAVTPVEAKLKLTRR